jgi:hypothetical protein
MDRESDQRVRLKSAIPIHPSATMGLRRSPITEALLSIPLNPVL